MPVPPRTPSQFTTGISPPLYHINIQSTSALSTSDAIFNSSDPATWILLLIIHEKSHTLNAMLATLVSSIESLSASEVTTLWRCTSCFITALCGKEAAKQRIGFGGPSVLCVFVSECPRNNWRNNLFLQLLRGHSNTHTQDSSKQPMGSELSWLENAYSRPVLSTGDLDQESRSGWCSFWCAIRIR